MHANATCLIEPWVELHIHDVICTSYMHGMAHMHADMIHDHIVILLLVTFMCVLNHMTDL